jgi:hypothetical protein
MSIKFFVVYSRICQAQQTPLPAIIDQAGHPKEEMDEEKNSYQEAYTDVIKLGKSISAVLEKATKTAGSEVARQQQNISIRCIRFY